QRRPALRRVSTEGVDDNNTCIEESEYGDEETDVRHCSDRQIGKRGDGVDCQLEFLLQAPAGAAVPARLLRVADGGLPESHPRDQREEADVRLVELPAG